MPLPSKLLTRCRKAGTECLKACCRWRAGAVCWIAAQGFPRVLCWVTPSAPPGMMEGGEDRGHLHSLCVPTCYEASIAWVQLRARLLVHSCVCMCGCTSHCIINSDTTGMQRCN